MNKSFVMGMVCVLGLTVVAQDIYVQGLADPDNGGKVAGSAFVAPGKSVTLTVAPTKGWAFTAWQDGGKIAKRVVPYAEAIANTNEAGVAEYTATFMEISSLPKPVVTAIDGVVTGMVGVAFSLDIEYDSLCVATVAATKLPGGLTLKNGVISGVPKKAGTTTVTLTASNPAGKSDAVQVVIEILPLPVEARGTFTGVFQEEVVTPADEPGVLATNTVVSGTLTMTVSAAGKISAKVTTDKGKVSFSAKSWSALTPVGVTVDLVSSKKNETLALVLDVRRFYELYGALNGGVFEGTDWWLDAQRKDFNAKGKVISDDWSDMSQLLFAMCWCPLSKQFIDYYWKDSTQQVFYAVGPLPKVSYNVAFVNQKMTALGDAENAPQGYGYLTLIVKPDGSVKFAGKLADGKAVSGSTTTMLCMRYFFYYCVDIPFYVPMYNGKGSFSGVLLTYSALYPSRSGYMEDPPGLPTRWVYPGKSPKASPPQTEDAFTAMLVPVGTVYSPYMNFGPQLKDAFYTNAVAFVANAPDLPYTYTKDGYTTGAVDAWTNLLPNVLLDVSKMTLPKAKAATVKNGSYVIDDANPAAATFSLAKNTGVFKGKFNVYYEYTDEKGAAKLKTVPVKHEGVLLPYYADSPLPSGAGFYQMPDAWVDRTDPTKPVTYKLNRSFGVGLVQAED